MCIKGGRGDIWLIGGFKNVVCQNHRADNALLSVFFSDPVYRQLKAFFFLLLFLVPEKACLKGLVLGNKVDGSDADAS